jgi:integrase
LNIFNSKKGKDQLLTALQKKVKSNGDSISAKESSEYMKRLSAIVKFIIDEHDLDITNKITGTYKVAGPTKERDTYNHADMKNLEEALCTVNIIAGRWPKPRNDRFWIIAIAILHGFRLASIVNLHRRHIVIDDDTLTLCFDLRVDAKLLRTKTEGMKILCPIHPSLIHVGFRKWLDSRELTQDDKLFEDTPESFGAWWNGLNGTSGWNYDHVTTDSKKTFHSFRHYFRMTMDELGISEKVINEMMGHARDTSGGTGRKHYAERTMVRRMKEVQLQTIRSGRILNRDLDFQRLRDRAAVLFNLPTQ